MTDLRLTQGCGSVRFNVHVQTRASKDEVAGLHGEALKVRLTAAPVEGAANEALINLLSQRFAVPARWVRIVAGAQSRAKVVEIDGITPDSVRRILTTDG